MKIFMLNTCEAGVDVLRRLVRDVPIAGVIGLSDRKAGDAISGFVYQEPHCRKLGIPFIPVDDYGLNDPRDRERIKALQIDLLLVLLGWQRLVPRWLLEHCREGAVGCHGSASGITAGRGRASQNWAILLGKKRYSVSIFWLDERADSGDLIDSSEFEISPFDSIRTVYHKCGLHVANMVIRAYRAGWLHRNGPRVAQPSDARYLPKRAPEDGLIDWSRSASEIYDFVRALAQPYPGAFALLDGQRLRIWRGIPFDIGESQAVEAGTILDVFLCGDFLVSAGTGGFLVQEYDFPCKVDERFVGKRLTSTKFGEQVRAIVNRHAEKYPDLPVAEDILRCI